MTQRKKPEHQGRKIRTTIRTTATPEKIFEAWADPSKLAQWFPDRAEGRAVEGGVQKWFFDRFNYALPYEVAAAVPGEHLVYTGVIPGRPRFYLEIEIARDAGIDGRHAHQLRVSRQGRLGRRGTRGSHRDGRWRWPC